MERLQRVEGRPHRPLAGLLALACAAGLAAPADSGAADADWAAIGRDAGGSRHSPLREITTSNVSRLSVAWVYHLRPEGEAPPPGDEARRGGPFGRSEAGYLSSESIPLVIDGTMFLATPYNRVVALDAATGKEIWAAPIAEPPATRGVAYWPGGGGDPPRIFVGTRTGQLVALDAATGRPVAGFGAGGVVDLKTPDVMVTGLQRSYGMNSPPVVYRDLIITGSNTGEGIGGPVGDVRAWSARTGALAWTFHSRPHPGEPGFGTWPEGADTQRSGVNVWGLMTVDAQRGIVYMPFGAPANDRIGVDRAGNNLFSSSIVAADAATGRYLWHFQLVHHDIWDVDTAAPPTLLEVDRGGRTIPAVALTAKSGLLFILDRVTGEPIFGVEERPVPPSDVPGEQASPTQPFPLKPEPLSRNTMSRADLSTVTPEHAAFCRALVDDNDVLLGGPYLPTAFNRPTVNFPGTLGGVNWAGGSYDPARGLYVVNVNNLGQVQAIVADPAQGIGFANRSPINGRFWQAETRMPCTQPPWGELVAVDVDTGEIAWRRALGVSDNLPDAHRETGRPSLGGPTTTASGVTFIAATDDARLRAFETATGRRLWETTLPGAAHTAPITFADRSGRQYVAITATGGAGFLGTPVTGDSLIAFALPEAGR